MKKLFTILFFLSALIANAQNTLNNISGLGSTAASVAYSLRQLSTSYTGPLVRIKVGASFYDVYPDVSTTKFSLSSKISSPIGTYNAAVAAAGTNALSTIISGSTDATLAIWYDQSGNGVHVLSNTSTAKIITAGSINTIFGQPTIYFSGTNGQSLLTSSNTVNYSALSGATVNAVAQNVATTSTFAGVIGAAYAAPNPGYNIAYDATIGKGYASDGAGCTYGGTSSSTSPQIITNIFTNTTSNLSTTYINGVLKTNSGSTCELTHTSGSRIYIGSARGYGPASFVGNISEAIIFPSQLSDAIRNPLESNQSSAYFSPTVTITSSASGAVCAGTNVTFTSNVYNFTSTPTYQWYKNGTAINGATSSTYSSTSLSNNDVIKVSAGDVIVTNSLIQNLDANNASSYTSGNTWTDLTGNGKNGTIVTGSSGTVAIATESNIKSFSFTKGLSYISAPVTKTASMSFNVWAKTSSLTNYNSPGTMLFNAGASGTGWLTGGPTLFISGNKIFWNTYDGTTNPFKLNGTDITPTTASINDNNWHCFTVLVEEVVNTASIYIDGVFKGTAVYKSPNLYSTTALFIGGEGNNANITNYDLAWVGNISAFQSYSRALSLAEVVQNFNAKASFFGVTSSASTFSNSITATVTLIATPTITVTGDACVNKTSLTTPSGLTSYAWYKDNAPISGAISNTYSPTTAGDYKVQVTSGSCSNTSTVTTIYTCAITSSGKMVSTSNAGSIISPEGGANFGTGKDNSGKLYNTTSFTTTSGSIGSTTAVLGGVISTTNAVTSSIGIMYSTDASFGTYSTTTIQSNVTAGTYTSTISGLSSSTNYHAKSFIVNKAGTSYGPAVSFSTSAPTLASTIVLDLDAGNSASYAGTGPTWTDLSGKGNHGTLVNSVTHNSAGYLVFSGNGPYVSLPKSTDFDFNTGDFTVENWIYMTSTNESSVYISLNVIGSSYAAFRMEHSNGKLYLSHSYDGTSYVNAGNFAFTRNAWQHIVVSRIAGSAVVYVNGVSKLAYSLPGSLIGQQNSQIGNLGRENSFYSFSGNIATTKIYKGKGLTSTEVLTQFNLTKSRFNL